MESLSSLVKLFNELDELGQEVRSNGFEALKAPKNKDKVARLLATYRSQTEKKTSNEPPSKRRKSTPTDVNSRIDQLKSFRRYIKGQISNQNLTLAQAVEVTEWSDKCDNVIKRVSVYVAKLGGDFKPEVVVEDANQLLQRGSKMVEEVPEGIRRDVARKIKDLSEAVKYLDPSIKPKMTPIGHNTERFPDPLTLTPQHPDALSGIPEPRVSRTQKNRLSLNRKSKKPTRK